MKNLYLTIILLFFCFSMFAQPSISLQKTYGGSGHEYAWKTIPTNDGGYAFVGFSESNDGDVSGNHGGEDLWVGKISVTGIIQWSFLYGGTADDEGYDIIQTSDNGFLVAGWSNSFDGDVTGHHGTYSSDVWVLKLTSTGTLTWNKCYGGTSADEAVAMAQSPDGNFFLTGYTSSNDGDISGLHGSSSDLWVIKINSTGALLYQKCIGGASYDEGIGICATTDNGCIISGRTSSNDGDATGYHGGDDMLVVKLSSTLTIDWAKCFGGTETEEGNSVVQLLDGSYAVLGYSSTQNNGDIIGHHNPQGADDYWLVKLTTTGTISWAKCYGGSGDDQADGLAKCNDGGFVLCGLTNSTDGDVTGFHIATFNPDIWVAKVNSTGTLIWQKCIGGSDQDESFNIFDSGNDTYVVTGFTYSTDFDVTNNKGSADGWIIWIAGNNSVEDNYFSNSINIFPNPTKEKIYIENKNGKTLEVSVFSINGTNIYYEKTNKSNSIIDLENIEQGIYLLEIQSDCEKTTKKFIKE